MCFHNAASWPRVHTNIFRHEYHFGSLSCILYYRREQNVRIKWNHYHPCGVPCNLQMHLASLQAWDEWGYLACGLFTVAPLILFPALRPGDADKGKILSERFWVKANVWHAVFGFVGNYFWTHYFFQLLGAAYTMPSHRLNEVGCYLYGTRLFCTIQCLVRKVHLPFLHFILWFWLLECIRRPSIVCTTDCMTKVLKFVCPYLPIAHSK
jgi:hypothetical protein